MPLNLRIGFHTNETCCYINYHIKHCHDVKLLLGRLCGFTLVRFERSGRQVDSFGKVKARTDRTSRIISLTITLLHIVSHCKTPL